MGGGATRRQLLGGSAAGALGLAGLRTVTAPAAPVTTDDRADVTHRGHAVAVAPRGTHVVVAHAGRPSLDIVDRRRHRTRRVKLAGHPAGVAVDPAGRLLAVTTAFWSHPGVELLDLRTGVRRARREVGADPGAPVFGADGARLLVPGGEADGTLRILSGADLATARTVALGRAPRGVAATASSAWVALHGDGVVARVDLARGRVARRLAVPDLPDRVALAPDRRRLLVSHGGHEQHRLTELDLRTGAVRRVDAGGVVAAVAWAPGGQRLAALATDAAIALVAPGRKPRRRRTVDGPRGLAVAGRHAFTTSAATGAIGRVRL